MESINNDLSNNKSYLNYTLKTFNNDGLVNDYIKSNPTSMYSSKPTINKKYPEFQSLQKHDYLSLFDINKVDYTNLISNTTKRHSGYFVTNLTPSENTSNKINNNFKTDDMVSKDQDSSENSKHSNLDLKETENNLSNKTADSSIASDSSLPNSPHKLSFGKSSDPIKIGNFNDENISKSPDISTTSNENDLQPTLTIVTNDNNIIINTNNNSPIKRAEQVIETQITAQTIYKKDEAQASPLFLKIMSKLSELPDSMLFSNTNHNTSNSLNKTHETNDLNSSNNASNTSTNNELNQSTESKQTVSDMMNSSDQQSPQHQIQQDKQHSQSIPIKLNEKVLKSLNKRNIVIVRRPTAPAPTPIIANKININRSLNKEKAASSYLESNILQKPNLNIVQRRLKDDVVTKRAKHRSMYVDSDLLNQMKYDSEISINHKSNEKYSSNLAMDGLNVFASPATYMSKIKEIHVDTIKTPSPDYDKKMKTPTGAVSTNTTTPTKKDENNQIEESLKAFSYLDNLDDSISSDDNKLIVVANKKSIDNSKEMTSLTIQTPSSLNYNIRMNSDKEEKHHHHHHHHPHHHSHNHHIHNLDEPTIKLKAKNNELIASINIMEASLTNKLPSPKIQLQDEKIEEIEKTANFDLSSNESETENSFYARKSSIKNVESSPKKNIIIKKVKTDPPMSPKKYENLRVDNANTAKITNNIVLVNNNNNNNNSTPSQKSSTSSKKPTKIVDIHLIEKPKNTDQIKEEKVKVKVPVIHTTAVTTTTPTHQRPVTMIEHIESEKNRNRTLKKNSTEKESTKNKIIIKKITPEETSKYHAELNNLKRFSGIVANTIDIKSIAFKPDRASLLSERPKTTVPMDTLASHQHPIFLRKISTPPPLPNILDKLEMLNSPKINHTHNHHNHQHYYDQSLDHEIKVINSQHIDAKNTVSSGLRPVSITSSIRSGKSEKPIRLNHGIPPPPSINANKESPQKHNIVTNQQQSSNQCTSSSKKYTNDFNSKKILPITSNLATKLKLNENNNKKSSHPESEIYIKESKNRTIEEEGSPKKEKYKIQATITNKKTTEKPSTTVKKVSIEEEKPKPKTLVLNGMSTNIPIDENFGGRCTNLPQLGAIDYIYKTSDDRYMTSQSPFTYDTNNNKKAKSKENDKSSKTPDTPSSARKSTNTPKHHQYNDDLIDKFDSSLPWSSKDLKNGKNFYENYAKENDRRKKEGNGFLMLLPGIAIPIDTDANDSDEDATSDSLD